MNEYLYPRMVHDYFDALVRKASAERDARLAAIRTPKEAQAYIRHVRQAIRRCFAPIPARTPLNPVVTGRLEREHYSIEKLYFESRPDYIVTANLYVPKAPRPKNGYPAVLGLCGHSNLGKAEINYQTFALQLARQGYVVLIIDPVSQGERWQYGEREGEFHPGGGCVAEHCMAGKQMQLIEDFFGTWRAWDGIRATDYLLSRPEIDPKRVGVTGNSGGGTLTSFVSALDDRFTMAAPSCYVTTFLANYENELPADSEQIPPGFLAEGLEMGDFFIAQAPRPVILLGQERDFFDKRGLEKTYAELKRFYKVLGAEKQVALHIGPENHGYSWHNREAMYRFFNRIAKVKAEAKEVAIEPESLLTLAATPDGRAVDVPGVRKIYEMTAETAAAIEAKRGAVAAEKLPRAITRALDLPRRKGVPAFRTLRALVEQAGPYTIDWRFPVLTGTDPVRTEAMLHAWQAVDLKGRIPWTPEPPVVDKAVVYVPHLSSFEDVRDGENPVSVPADQALYSVDVRGIGSMRAMTCGQSPFLDAYDADYFYDAYALLLGQHSLGHRVHDLLCALDLLVGRGTQEIHLVGRGLGSIFAAIAGALHPAVRRVTLKHYSPSFFELTQTPVIGWPQSVLARGVLKHFDLPDCHRLLKAEKKLTLIDPWDARLQPRVAAAGRKKKARRKKAATQ